MRSLNASTGAAYPKHRAPSRGARRQVSPPLPCPEGVLGGERGQLALGRALEARAAGTLRDDVVDRQAGGPLDAMRQAELQPARDAARQRADDDVREGLEVRGVEDRGER